MKYRFYIAYNLDTVVLTKIGRIKR